MKEQILTTFTLSILMIVTLAILGYAQDQDVPQSQVPSEILNQFNSQFPDATNVEWEMKGDLYNVEFEIGWIIDLGWNNDHEVWYNAASEMVKHKEDISPDELPEPVNNRIKTDFNGYTIDDLKRITDKGVVVYKMELNSSQQQDWDVVIDDKGDVVNKKSD